MVPPPPMPVGVNLNHFNRTNSLALSDISTWGADTDFVEDFVDPFLDESCLDQLTTEVPSTPVVPANGNATPSLSRQGLLRNVSSDEGREEYQRVGETYSLSSSSRSLNNNVSNNNYPNQYSLNNRRSYPSTSIHDFNEELRSVMDAVHPEDDLTSPPLKEHPAANGNGSNINMPTLLLPWRGGALQRRYGSSGGLKKTSSNGSNSHRSISIGELMNERQ